MFPTKWSGRMPTSRILWTSWGLFSWAHLPFRWVQTNFLPDSRFPYLCSAGKGTEAAGKENRRKMTKQEPFSQSGGLIVTGFTENWVPLNSILYHQHPDSSCYWGYSTVPYCTPFLDTPTYHIVGHYWLDMPVDTSKQPLIPVDI